MNVETCEKVVATGYTTSSGALSVLDNLNEGVYLDDEPSSLFGSSYQAYKVTITIEAV